MSKVENISQRGRAKIALDEMKKELTKLKQDITFREYIGYEMCMNKFKKRYSHFLNKRK